MSSKIPCTKYAVIRQSGVLTPDADVVIQVVRALKRGAAVELGDWFAHPTSRRLLKGGPDDRNLGLFLSPAQRVQRLMKLKQPAEAGVFSDLESLAHALVAQWRAETGAFRPPGRLGEQSASTGNQ